MVKVLNHGVVIEPQLLVLMKSANQWKSEDRIICKTDELQIFGLWEHRVCDGWYPGIQN